MGHHERISSKLGHFRPSLTLELKRIVQERLAAGLPVYDFGLGETKGDLAPRIGDAGAKAFHEGRTQYADPAGLPDVRQAVLAWLGLEGQYQVENVVITSGAKQALFNVMLAVCNPGDAVLFDAAPWVSYLPQAAAASTRHVVVQPQAGDANYLKITGDDLRRALKQEPGARVFLLNSPVNPTGQVYSADEVEALLQVCVEQGVYFLLDRLYWRLMFDRNAYPEPRVDDDTKPWLIQVDGLSKNFRRTGGIRIGWSVAPTDVTKAMINLQSHYTSGPAVPTQHAALAGIACPYSNELRDDLQHKRDLLLREAPKMRGVRVWPTAGAFYSFWDVRALIGKRMPDGGTIKGSDDLAAYLLKNAGVVTASGAAFEQDGYLRISFATPDDHITGGVAAAAAAFGQLV
jgi:aspartate aminotransferase